MFNKVLTVAVLAAAVAPAFCAEWMTDWDAAKKRAKAEKKAILADFTGSDWCSACKQLHEKVLNTPEFHTFSEKNFVLLEVDVPMHPTFGKEQLQKNQALVKEYHVQGFPTLLVMTADGTVAGGFVGARNSMLTAQGVLEAGLANVKVLNKAAKTKDKAKQTARLVRVYKSLGEDVRPCAAALRERILAQGPEGEKGLAYEQAIERQRQELGADTVTLFSKTPQQMTDIVKKYEGSLYPENRLAFLQVKMTALLFNAETEEDLNRAKETLLRDADDLPDKELIAEQINHQFADPAALLKEMQQFKQQQAAPQN